MTPIDRLLCRWRVAKARRHVPAGARLLDVGAGDGTLLRALRGRIAEGVGIDPLAEPVETADYRIVRGFFPADVPDVGSFDVITMLAVLEHIPEDAQSAVVAACHQLLNDGGVVVVTTPAPAVDRILDVLAKLRVIDGMELDQHYGFEPAAAIPLFTEGGFTPVADAKFQLGLNRLFVFRRAAA
jgi:2-polyprenyl-3-methyl-5-hydroxy-6-metoxy-1,4-benzoquinol methylase